MILELHVLLINAKDKSTKIMIKIKYIAKKKSMHRNKKKKSRLRFRAVDRTVSKQRVIV